VVGAAYTSVSFLRTVSGAVERHWRATVIAFIAVSAATFLVIGRPVKVLVLVGALNGLILPVSLGAMLVAAHRRAIVGEYRHPVWLTAAGVGVAIAMAALGVWTLITQLPALWA
jgi:Mn2+/Fe2+ NRAMP family transporter